MAEGKLTTSLQESVLTLLCMDQEQGALAANLVDTELFEPPYDDIAARAITFRKKFGKAPGESHLDDLFDHILSDPKNKKKRLYTQVLSGILEQAKGLNGPYVVSRVNEFMRRQNLKVAVLEAADRYGKGDDNLVEDVEGILHKALKFKVDQLDAGTFLSDRKRVLSFLGRGQKADYLLGIPELDRRGIGPTFGEALGFMAPKGKGKTWFCIHGGVMCWLQGAVVAHASCEMQDERVVPRYLQRMFAIAKRDETYKVTNFDLDELGRVTGFTQKKQRPRLYLEDPKIEERLAKKMDHWGQRFGSRMIVKSFPTSSLTMGQLEAWLDGLEMTHGITPNVLILDYPKLMALDRRQELRIALGLRMEELRGLCMRRKMAGIFPFQSNREAEKAKLITASHTGEDYSLTQTCDNFLTYNQTKAEKALGLSRLYVEKARNDDDGFAVLLSQSYKTGQFVRQSAYLPVNYFEHVRESAGDDSSESD